MKNLLKRIGLSISLITELPTTHNTFINRLDQVVEKPPSGFLNTCSNNKKEYVGTIGYDSFNFKRKQFGNQQNQMQASVIGKVYQKGDKLVIESEITGYSKFLIFFLGVLIFFYTVFISYASGIQTGLPVFVIPFIFLHGILMVHSFYRMLKRAVAKLKYDLEREFFYLTR